MNSTNFALKFTKWVGGLFVIILLLVTIPMWPSSMLDRSDPASINDKRISALISNNDLKEIIYLVRGADFISILDFLVLLPHNEILSVYNLKNYELTKKMPENKTAVVSVGTSCGRLCGSGVDIYLYKKNRKWEITNTKYWVN